MTKAKFKILNSRELTTADIKPEYLGMMYDIQLDDADGVMVQYRVSAISSGQSHVWSIAEFGVTGHIIDPTSRFGKKIVNACKQTNIFIQSDDSGSMRFNQQNFS
jgi:hypothetical protein